MSSKPIVTLGVSDTNAQSCQGRRTWLVLALLLALAAVARVLSFRGYYHSDAGHYARLAHLMASGQFKICWQGIFATRVGLFAPVALAFKVGGVNEVTLTAYPLLLSMLGILVAYLATKAMLGTRAGLVAACLAAFLPIDLWSASWLLPDMPAALWMNAGVLLVYIGSQQKGLLGKVVSGALAGLALGVSWLHKETVLYLLPFVGFYALWLVVKNRRNVALLIAGTALALLLVGLESWTYHRYTGDYLFRYHAIYRNYDASAMPIVANPIPVVGLTGIGKYLVHRTKEVTRAMFLNPDFALILAGALIACAYAAFMKSRHFVFPALWFGWLLLVYSFGSASLRLYQPLSMDQARFLYPMLLPAILLASGLMGSLLSPLDVGESSNLRRERLFWGGLMSICIAGVALLMTARHISAGMGRPCRVERELSRVLKPTDPLYTDYHTKMRLEFFWGYPPADSTHDWESKPLSQIPPEAYVLLNRDRRAYADQTRDGIPSGWQKLRVMDNATLYRVSPATR
jgi:4-amino-4-deoxy-L-arabinose transferase-like glycosyltransferase